MFLPLGAIANSINVNDPFVFSVEMELSSATDTAQEFFTLGVSDFYCSDVIITAKDSDGDDMLTDSKVADLFSLKLETEGGDKMMKDYTPLQAFDKLVRSDRFKGMLFNGRSRISVDVKGNGFPSSSVSNYPVYVYVGFAGYRVDRKVIDKYFKR